MTRGKTILLVSVVPQHLGNSGASNVVARLSRALAKYANVAIFVDGRPSTSRGSGTRIRALKNYLLGKCPRSIRTIWGRYPSFDDVDVETVELIHIHNALPSLEVWRWCRFANRHSIPVMVSVHGIYEVSHPVIAYGLKWWQRPIWLTLVTMPLRSALRRAESIQLFSPSDASIVEGWGIGLEKTFILENGIDRSVTTTELLRAESASLSKGIPSIFFLANHTRNKGIDVLLASLDFVDMECRVVVGGETRTDVSYDFDPNPLVRVEVTGRLSNEEVRRHMIESDLFVFPTRADTYPLVILEAMESGCAILSSDISGIPYQVNGDCSLLISPGEPKRLGQALNTLIRDQEQLRRMKAASILRSRNLKSWDQVAALLNEKYDEVVTSMNVKLSKPS